MLLSQEDRRQVEDNANFLLDNFGVKYPPIPILDIIKAAIPYSKVYNEETMPEGIKGICIIGFRVCDIYIGMGYSENPQRFTAGHELGHALEQESGCKGKDAFSEASKFQERRADYWAACLLMPRWLVASYWRVFPQHQLSNIERVESGIDKIASVFEVSSQAMTIRLKHLKLIPMKVAEFLLGTIPNEKGFYRSV